MGEGVWRYGRHRSAEKYFCWQENLAKFQILVGMISETKKISQNSG